MGSFKSFWKENPHRNLWQHPFWGEFQRSIGRKSWFFEEDGASAVVVRYELPFGLCWLEVPRGPLFKDKKNLNKILKTIEKKGRSEKAVFIRLSPFEKLDVKGFKFRISKYDHHPTTSLTIDLKQEEDDILKQMKPKGRYNIKVARKHKVKVEPSTEIDAFYDILKKTGNRDGFGIHPKSYYEKMLEVFGDQHLQLLLADLEGKVIAGGIFIYMDNWGIYYYGASDNNYRNVMAPYLIQWEAIKEAKERGCKHYDFLGIAPEHAKKHPWKGVTEFKKKFGGQVVSYPHAKEIVLRPFWYWIYRIYKRLRK